MASQAALLIGRAVQVDPGLTAPWFHRFKRGRETLPHV